MWHHGCDLSFRINFATYWQGKFEFVVPICWTGTGDVNVEFPSEQPDIWAYYWLSWIDALFSSLCRDVTVKVRRVCMGWYILDSIATCKKMTGLRQTYTSKRHLLFMLDHLLALLIFWLLAGFYGFSSNWNILNDFCQLCSFWKKILNRIKFYFRQLLSASVFGI